MQLSEFRTTIWERLGVGSSDAFFDSTTLNDFINRSIREISKLADAYELTTSFASYNGKQEYRLPTDFWKVKSVSWINGTTEYPLELMDIRQARMRINTSVTASIPSGFAIWGNTRNNTFIYLFPKPNTTFTNIRSPGAATVGVSGTAGITGTNLRYKVTYITDYGETDGGTQSATVSPATQQVDVSAIPSTTNTTVIGRRVYRLQSSGAVYFLLTQINDRATTTTYTDTTNDNDLGPELIDQNSANNLIVRYYAIPGTDLSAATDTPMIPSPDFDEAIIDFTMYLCQLRNGNPRDAQLYLTLFENEIGRMKGDLSNRHRGQFVNVYDNSYGAALGRGYPFTTPISSG